MDGQVSTLPQDVALLGDGHGCQRVSVSDRTSLFLADLPTGQVSKLPQDVALLGDEHGCQRV
jgi:hypothetical protein